MPKNAPNTYLTKAEAATLLCGIWSCGLGLRLAYELLISGEGTYIMIPVHIVNIAWDFLPLGVLGLIVTVMMVAQVGQRIIQKG